MSTENEPIFTLEPWRMEYAPAVSKYADNTKTAENLRSNFPHPYTLKDAEEFIYMCMQADTCRDCYRAIVLAGEAVGSIAVMGKDDELCKSAKLGYWLGEPFWGSQIISRAIKDITALAFGELDIVRIFAQPYSYNIGSRRALESNGFALEGVMKKAIYKGNEFYNSCMYALLSD